LKLICNDLFVPLNAHIFLFIIPNFLLITLINKKETTDMGRSW